MSRHMLVALGLYLAGMASAALLFAPAPSSGVALAAQASGATAALEQRLAAVEADLALLKGAIAVNNAGAVTINAPKVKVNAAQFEVSGAAAQFGGIIKGKTLQVDSVISKSYTPGAGNVW